MAKIKDAVDPARAKSHISDPGLKDRFIALLDGGARVVVAARELGLCAQHFYNERQRDTEFGKRWSDALRRSRPFRGQPVAWTHARGEAFLAAFAELGSASAAAASIGVPVVTAYVVRERDRDFAAAWWQVRQQVAEQIDDKLIEGALNGYEEVVVVDGREVKRTRRANPRMMLKMVERIAADKRSGGGVFIELTPERIAKARNKLIARLTHGGSLTTMAEAIAEAARMTTPERNAVLAAATPEAIAAAVGGGPVEIVPKGNTAGDDAVPVRSLWD